MVDIRMEGDDRSLARLRNAMSPEARARIVPVVTRRVFNFIQKHFREYAQSHHETADRLGAKHTKHMENAARNMTHVSTPDEGRVILAMDGIGRAFHDVTIRMRDRRLTIPISKESYGHLAIEMERKYGKLFVFRSKAGNSILAASVEKGRGKGRRRTTIPLYVLKEEVFQRQDPKMLPTREEIDQVSRDAFNEAVERFLKGA